MPSAAAPLLTYAKGTDVQKPRTLANPSDSETFSLIAMFAAQGYAVVATDYLGFAKSGLFVPPVPARRLGGQRGDRRAARSAL